MFQHKVLRSSKQVSISGKVFVLGEYAILAGFPAVVATVPPRFGLRVTPSSSVEGGRSLAQGSPMARLLDWAQTQGLPELGLEWVDPYQGAGGFGASTAQFALAYFAFMQASAERAETAGDWKSAWDLYRSLMGSDVLVPSGADLVAQWQGGVVEFDPRLFRAGVDPGAQPVVEDLWQCFDWSQLLVFSTTHQPGRKVATHDHLKQLSAQDFLQRSMLTECAAITRDGVQSIRRNDAAGLGHAFSAYARLLAQNDLEVESTRQDRLALVALPDVLGVKGAGALQSDALLVLVKSGTHQLQRVLDVAAQRGLKEVCRGLIRQEGIACQTYE